MPDRIPNRIPFALNTPEVCDKSPLTSKQPPNVPMIDVSLITFSFSRKNIHDIIKTHIGDAYIRTLATAAEVSSILIK